MISNVMLFISFDDTAIVLNSKELLGANLLRGDPRMGLILNSLRFSSIIDRGLFSN